MDAQLHSPRQPEAWLMIKLLQPHLNSLRRLSNSWGPPPTIVAGLFIGGILFPDSYENEMRILRSKGRDLDFAWKIHQNFSSGKKTLEKHDWQATNILKKEYFLKKTIAYSIMIAGVVLGVLIIIYGSRLKERLVIRS